jgi:hypothetical protein
LPTYKYQCECGVQFSAANKASKSKDPMPCPGCDEAAPRAMPNTVSGHFNKDVDGPGPQNTGIHGLDTHIDRVIGKSTEQSMAVIEERQKAKRRLVRDGADPNLITRDPDGQYRTITKDEKGFAVRANVINSRAMKKGLGKKNP